MLRRVQERHGVGSIPVVMFSGQLDAGSEAARRGAQGFVGKPFDVNEMVRTVGAVWQRTAATRGTQMVFCDMGVNPTQWGYSAYGEVITTDGDAVSLRVQRSEAAAVHLKRLRQIEVTCERVHFLAMD
jgi:DNA-binding response OmpR family regulator